SSACDSDSSLADGRFCFLPASARDSEDDEEKEEGVDLDEAQQLEFLHAIYPACLAAQERGDYTLEPHCSKAAVAERIVELIEELPPNSPPGAILANSLIAVANLSTMTPALEPELETHLLQATLHAVFTLGTQTDTNQVQDLHRVIPGLLDAMLGNLLAKTPDTDKLHYILEHINYWTVSRVPQERARAIRSSAALLTSVISLPDFDNSAEFPRMGHHVAQLALCVDLNIHEVEDLWCWDWHQDTRLLGYKNTARVGEVFAKFFSEGQRRFFLQTAVLAMHDPLLR
ncbi:uncharacterized protein LOC113408968, partial [Terrapene carolina triunguis]|uniref:uncharacterized protein LOC113408968 n=1 Tax=Terrapene triunguis TaxID=2587831 RepID=UPI000E779EF0